jgi:phage repressor protein C with HTH and peptisase S24 domain
MNKYQHRRLALERLVEKVGSQSKLADIIEMNASYISRLLYDDGKPGKKNIGEDTVEKINKHFPGWSAIDPSIDLQTESHTFSVKYLNEKKHSDVLDVPLLNAVASMGNGNHQNDTDIVIDMLSINRSWASKTLKPYTDLKNLSFIHAIGDSMHPTFNDGDVLMIDTGDKSITADKIYVLQAHERLFIKRVRQRLDGVFEISSDNPSVKTVDVLNGEHDVEVLGRVVWVWNGRKL